MTASSAASTSSSFNGPSSSPSHLHARSAFLAGDEIIRIVPSFNYKSPLGLISRSVGPFRAGVDAPVPLWLAVHLRRRNLCRIKPPLWMEVDHLKEVLRFERDPNEASFSPDLPFRHAEVARAILSACGAGSGSGSAGTAGGSGGDGTVEIPNADTIKILLEDISTVRLDKIRRNVHTLSAQNMSREDGSSLPVIDVTGIGSLEMQAVRPFVLRAFRDHRSLTGKDSIKSGNNTEGRTTVGGSKEGRERAIRRARTGAGDEGGVEQAHDSNLETTSAPSAQNTAPAVGRSRLRRFR
mmetsp:Transcript_656/g.1995  ORF Transcript_656/g.1995 Transcript_656/m.1995 type:complete len:296 (-) Transcript_656:62-949(-)|eukprot:CAMPEP_0113526754 /NCGR_PEP_ID=MMETSP0015_2-20120614/919_1 /TAXON_ID=2838 /ORGANISM="Odontella" /LENGTH=295 /DNA_ID=CAMNT_0000425119 /DNA_START=218 /DNA_END=1105 /DNA_ORIENTATION=+ /assembly_acc=CAM_ASM_000160